MLNLTKVGLRRFWSQSPRRNAPKKELSSLLESTITPKAFSKRTEEPNPIMQGTDTIPMPFYLHAKCLKNNTHITLCSPERKIIFRASGGTCGFRKGKRRGYDAAYTICSKVLEQIQVKRLGIENLHVIFHGFSQAREAVQNCLLGQEGAVIRDKIVKVMDRTPIKFGGPRGRRERRI
ncbi:putative 37S ribosomal protein S18, mitochondrial [Schizosaccharomyces pombe]|uniref:Small ribosomal subunit protein uS11m n=1 Tax=Schizosaccharomyces pombe (strain 972 / ATCC 24843) TaxID=284812 RepID=RT18_SCHPO